MIPELLITSAKEVVLSIALKEAATEFEGVEVVAGIRKEKALNAIGYRECPHLFGRGNTALCRRT